MLLVRFRYCPITNLTLYFEDKRDFFFKLFIQQSRFVGAELHMQTKVSRAEGLCQFHYSFLLRMC